MNAALAFVEQRDVTYDAEARPRPPTPSSRRRVPTRRRPPRRRAPTWSPVSRPARPGDGRYRPTTSRCMARRPRSARAGRSRHTRGAYVLNGQRARPPTLSSRDRTAHHPARSTATTSRPSHATDSSPRSLDTRTGRCHTPAISRTSWSTRWRLSAARHGTSGSSWRSTPATAWSATWRSGSTTPALRDARLHARSRTTRARATHSRPSRVVVEWLFRRRKVHRIAATIDPRQSCLGTGARAMRVRVRRHDSIGALVRGKWSDDASFSLLAAGLEGLARRPTSPPARVGLVEITADNVSEVGDIERSFSQRELVAPVLVSLAEALVPPTVRGETVRPWIRAIDADGDLVGFVMMTEPYEGSTEPDLLRFLMSTIVTSAAGSAAEHSSRSLPNDVPPGTHTSRSVTSRTSSVHRRASTSTSGSCRPGVVDDGETEARLDLSSSPTDERPGRSVP